MSHKRKNQKCLFCAAPCSLTFTIVEGQVKRLKRDPETEQCHSHPSFLEEQDTPLLAEQLKGIFILKNLLEIRDEKLYEFLGKLGGQLNPEFWVQLCSSCEEAVHKYYEVLKESFKLQKRLKTISSQLKEHIIRGSRATDEDEDDNNAGNEETAEDTVWKEVREEVIKTIPANLKEYEYPTFIFEEENENEEDMDIDESLLHIPTRDPIKDEVNSLDYLSLSLEEDAESSQNVINRNSNPQSLSNFEIQEPSCHKSNAGDPGEIKQFIFPDLTNVPPLKYLIFREDRKTRYKCLDCSFEAYSFGRLKQHFELHRPGSDAVACSFCGMLVASGPRRLKLHETTYHPHAFQLRAEPGKPKHAWHDVYECVDCGAIYQNRGRLNAHRKLHEEGGGEKCLECGWLVKSLAQHVGYWHPLDGTRVAEIRRQKAPGDIYYA